MMNILSTSDSAIHDVASAEAALQLHDDHRRAIEAREDTVVKASRSHRLLNLFNAIGLASADVTAEQDA